MTKLSNVTILLAASAGIIATPALADGPLTAKVEVFSGYNDPASASVTTHNGFAGGIAPTLTLNAGHGIGIQADGLLARVNGTTTVAGGGHLYWRNPSKGLIGIAGSLSSNTAGNFGFNNTVNGQKIGAEAELYLKRFTLSGAAGYEHTSYNLFFVPSSASNFYSKANIAYYPNDNWKISVGHRYINGTHAAAMGTELSLTGHGATGVSIFAEGRFGEKSYNSAFTGIKIYFGGKKTLIDRQRTEDPENELKNDGSVQAPTCAPQKARKISAEQSCGSYNLS